MRLIKRVMPKVLAFCLVFSFFLCSLLPSSVAKATEEFKLSDIIRPGIGLRNEDISVSGFYGTLYVYNSNNLVNERYLVETEGTFEASNSSFFIDYSDSYVDASEQLSALCFTFVLPDNSYLSGQTYDIEFTINTSRNYIYSYIFSDVIPVLPFGKTFSDVWKLGTPGQPHRVNSVFRELLGNMTNNIVSYNYGTYAAGTHRLSISLPENYNRSENAVTLNMDNKLEVYTYITSYGRCDSIYISNISLIPTGTTVNLFNDRIYQDDVIGSDEEGQESGLKGIVSLIKNLGTKISEGFSNLLNGIIEGIKSLFVPDEQFFSDMAERWRSLYSDRFGAVYQVLEVLETSWINIRHSDVQDSIDIPVVTIPLPDNNEFSFGGYSVRVVPEGFEFIVTMVKTVTTIALVIMFIRGLRRKYDEVITK